MTTVRMDKWIHDVSPDDRTCAVAKRTLKARFGAVLHYLPLAAEKADEDIEYVHELRVWTRRAAAALRLYAGLLPQRKVRWMKKQLKRIRRAANDARDYDVLAQRVSNAGSDPQAKRLLAKVQAQRRTAQQPLVALYERLHCDDRFERRLAKLLRRARPPGKSRAESKDPRFGKWAQAQLRPVVKKFFKAAPVDGSDMAALHAFRIRSKELRYAMELLAGAFPPRFREQLYPIVETLQDKLGAINDLATAQVRLRERIEAADDATEVVHWYQVLAEENACLKQSQQAFRRWCTPQFVDALRAEFHVISAGAAQADPCLKARTRPSRSSASALRGSQRDASHRQCCRKGGCSRQTSPANQESVAK